MSEIRNHTTVKKGSEKSFGIVFSFVFLIVSLYPLFFGEKIRLWCLLIASILLIFSYTAPKVFSLPNRLWFQLGMILGAFVAPIVMSLIYFSVVVPIGLIIKTLGKDLLRQNLEKTAKSYWIKREDPIGSLKNQF